MSNNYKLCRHCKYYWPLDVYSGECRHEDSEANEIFIRDGYLTHYTIVCGCQSCKLYEEDEQNVKN